MTLQPGTKVLVARRRLFQEDPTRYHAGAIEACENGLARITCTTWICDGYQRSFHRKEGLRTKIVSLATGSQILYQLPSTVHLESLDFHPKGTRVYLRDEDGFELDVTEGVLHAGEPLMRSGMRSRAG